MEFKFDYNKESDVLSIYNYEKKVEESIQVSEDIVLDLDDSGRIIGIEIFYASELFNLLNSEINKKFLQELVGAFLDYKEFRNQWFVVVGLKSKNYKIIYQPMPLLRKSEYVSPLIASQNK